MNTRFAAWLSFVLLPFSCLLCGLVCGGCTSKAPMLVVHSDAKRVAYEQIFTQAVADHAEDGTFHFVLVADDVRPPEQKSGKSKNQASPTQRLDPARATPLHQVVYLKVLWRPMGGTDHSIGANAA